MYLSIDHFTEIRKDYSVARNTEDCSDDKQELQPPIYLHFRGKKDKLADVLVELEFHAMEAKEKNARGRR